MDQTNGTGELVPDADYGLWTFVIIFETALLVFSAYLLFALIWHIKQIFESSQQNRSTGSQKLKSILLALFTAYVTLGIAKFSFAQIVYYALIPVTLGKCAAIGKTYQFIHAIGTTCLYSFLWLRQNTLYREPSLSRLATKHVKRFSCLVLVVILATGASGAVGVLISTGESDFAILNGTNACYYVVKTGFNAVVVYIGYALVIIIQVSLLYLFVHILHRHKEELSNHLSGKNSSSAVRIRRLVCYCSAAALVSAGVDFTVVIIDPFIKGYIIQLVTNWIWDCDYAINMLCTLFCFANWREILFPWTSSTSDSVATTSSGATSTS